MEDTHYCWSQCCDLGPHACICGNDCEMTMSDLTERLAEAMAVCEGATEGPWKYGQAARGNPADGPDHVEVGSRRGVIADLDLAPQAALDAQFISEARTGYPAALRALQAVMELCDTLSTPTMHDSDRQVGRIEGLREVRRLIKGVYGDE